MTKPTVSSKNSCLASTNTLVFRPLSRNKPIVHWIRAIDIDGVLCYKEIRKVARDNTVQYHGKTLQIFPGPERTSYARAHVEVQERLDGRLVICYRGKILTPFEAPPLAASLHAQPTRSRGWILAELATYSPAIETLNMKQDASCKHTKSDLVRGLRHDVHSSRAC